MRNSNALFTNQALRSSKMQTNKTGNIPKMHMKKFIIYAFGLFEGNLGTKMGETQLTLHGRLPEYKVFGKWWPCRILPEID